MNDTLKKDYVTAKQFWDTAFAVDEKARADMEHSVDRETGWRALAPSEKLFRVAESLGQCGKVLDYGCGRGWAAIIAAGSGCADVTAVDVSANAAESAAFQAKLFGMDESMAVRHVSDTWLADVPVETYDGIFCSNVLDVVPQAVAESILEHFARIARRGAPVVIGMNYYMEPKDDPEKKRVVRHGNHIYLNDVLRLVSRTDEEWTETLSRYFSVEKLEHFSWPGEETERRRLFYLRKE